MASQSPEEFQKEFNTVRNKQVEMFERLGQLEMANESASLPPL